MSNLKGIENGRAEFAYKCAEQIVVLNNELVSFDFQCAYPNPKNGDQKAKNAKDEFMINPKGLLEKEKGSLTPFEQQLLKKFCKDQDEYKSYAKNIPMMVKTNGVGATFAFIKSKNKTAYDLLYKQTNAWLKHPNCSVKIEDDLLVYLVKTESHNYRAVTIEVLAFFGWLRRFADGLIEGDD